MLDAARELFAEHGYVATPIGAIAARAGVSPETVYAAFGNKRSLLSGLLARNGRLILERTAPVYEVLRGAAAADPEIASLWERAKAPRLAGQRELLRVLTERAPLRRGLPVAAATDILFAVGSPETYRLLVVDRGWSADRFERWYADALARLLLEEQP